MPTATRLPSLTDRLAAVEAAHRERVETNRLLLTGASSELTAAEEAIETAEDRVTEVQAALTRGSSEFTSDDLVSARGDLEAAQLILTGTEQRIERARKLKLNASDIDAALGVVSLIHRVLPGVPVHVTASAELPELTAADAPVAIIQQVHALSRDDGLPECRIIDHNGRVKIKPPELRVNYLRSSIHRVLEMTEWRRAATDLGLKVDVPHGAGIATELADGLWLDRPRLVTWEPAPLPTVTVVDTSAGSGLAKLVGSKVVESVVGMKYQDSSATVTYTEDEGLRTVVAKGAVDLSPVHVGGPASQRTTGSPQELVGTFVAGLGRLSSLTTNRVGVERVEFTAELVSRTSHEVPHPPIEA